VPLDEPAEKYRVEILDDGAVRRAIDTTEQAALYLSADEIADFGAPQSLLSVRVAQVSSVVGAGRARTATLAL
jgi:hypothetical protein